MAIIKPSEAFPSGSNWISLDVRAFIKDQVALHVDLISDVNDNDFEQTRFVYVRENSGLYRLDLSSTDPDDGDQILRDNIGRRYEKVASGGGGGDGDGGVSSVAITVPPGFQRTGSPITGAGTIAISYASGYQGYTTAEAAKLGYVNVTQNVNLDTVESDVAAAKAKTDFLTVTANTDLDAIRTRVNSLDAAVILMGTWSAAGGTFPGGGTAQAGESWIVSTGGTVDGQSFTAGDRIIAIADNASTSTYASNWFKADYTDAVQSVDGATGAVTVGAIIAAATSKASPVDADTLALSDSAAANATKKLTWANLKATLKSYFDGIYQVAGSYLTGGDIGASVQAHSAAVDQIAALSPPGVDRILFWDHSALAYAYLTVGANLSISGTTLNATGGGGEGGGDMFKIMYDPDGIEADAFDRANHTGTQLAATISDFSTAADGRVSAAVGLTVQAYDATLAALAGLNSTAGMVVQTGSDAFTKRVLAGTANQITVTNGDGVSGAPTFSLPSAITVPGSLTLNADGSSAMHAVTKQQLDALAVNLGRRQRVKAATTANITISTALNAGDVIDGVTLANGDLVLVKNQTTGSQNGIYVVSASPARASEFDTYDEHPGSIITVSQGTTNDNTIWLCDSNEGGTLGSTAIAFTQMRVAGELLAANNLSDLANASTARTNLGVAIGSQVQGYDAATAKLNVEDQTVSGGARITIKDLGNLSAASITPDPGDRPSQKITNNGAGSILPGSNYGSYRLLVINTTGAGAITTTGWILKGDSFDTATTSKFLCGCEVYSDMAVMTVLKVV